MKIIKYIYVFFFVISQNLFAQNQNSLVKNFGDGDYQVFKVENESLVQATKTWPLKLFFSSNLDTENNKVIEKVEINRANVVLEAFQPDIPNYPAYFGSGDSRITFLKDYVIYYNYAQEHATIKYVLCKNCSKPDYKSLNTELDSYILGIFKNQKSAREQIATNKQKQQEAEKIKYSLKGKNIQNIEIVVTNLPTELGHFSQILYGIQATLSDGQVFKTPNLGGKTDWENFVVEVQGAEFGEEKLQIHSDCSKIPSDQIRIKVTSKYHPNITTTKSIDVLYNAPIEVNYSGGRGGTSGIYVYAGARGQNGQNLDVYVKPSKHKKNGSSLVQLEVRSMGKVLHQFKITPNTPINIYTNGGNGSYGDKSKAPGNGGNGGDVTIYKDPTTPNLSINVQNRGGSGGKYKESKIMAANGSSGSFRTINQNVNLNW
jgi:hypothetical protein